MYDLPPGNPADFDWLADQIQSAFNSGGTLEEIEAFAVEKIRERFAREANLMRAETQAAQAQRALALILENLTRATREREVQS